MMPFVRTYFFFIIAVFTSFAHTIAQQKRVFISERITNEPIPFAHIALYLNNNDTLHLITDMDGTTTLPSVAVDILQASVSAPSYQSLLWEFTSKDTIQIQLTTDGQRFPFSKSTDEGTAQLIRKVIANKKLYHPDNWQKLSFQTYNKFTVDYGGVDKVKGIANKLFAKFKFINKTIDTTFTNQHLLMMETVTKRDYFDYINHKETIMASKVSGIKKPVLFGMTSQLQPLSIYEEQPLVLGKEYWSPLIDQALNWYYFETIDTAITAQDTVYIVKFNPLNRNKIAFLKGYLYISTQGYAVSKLLAEPAINKATSINYWQSYTVDSAGFWFPYRTETGLVKNRFDLNGSRLRAVDRSTIFELHANPSLRAKQFDEVSVDYSISEDERTKEYWQRMRKERFTEQDSLTYVFYDSAGNIQNFEKIIRLAEGLYYGEIPYKNVDILLSRFLDFNQYEGIRLGFGMQSNERLLHWATLGGYIGYGTLDNRWKYGVFGSLKILPHDRFNLLFKYSDDVMEAAETEFYLDEPQFKSEALRRYRILIKDQVIRKEIGANFHPLKYVDVQVGILQDEVTPQYDYRFASFDEQQYTFGEWRVGLRFAFAEHFLESINRRVSFGTDYPTLWAQVTKGYKGFLNGMFDYTKFDFKMQQSYHFLGFGTSSVQLRMGKVWGEVPYSRLYHGRGSYRFLAAISRNSFETMGYNEFLADAHISIFYTHNFGNIYLRKLSKQPSLEMSHNIGFGSLSNPELHDIGFKTFERGYFESGIFMNNLLATKAFGINFALGAGVFARYGPYAFPKFGDNFVGKIAIAFQL